MSPLIAYLSSLQTDLYFKLKLLVMQPQAEYYAFIVFSPSDGDVAHYSIWPDILRICPSGTQLLTCYLTLPLRAGKQIN